MVKLSLCLTKYRTMKTYGGVEVQGRVKLSLFLTKYHTMKTYNGVEIW
jgi:hypothetical protein